MSLPNQNLKKFNKKWHLSFLAFVTVLFFQNCGSEFQTLDDFKNGSHLIKNNDGQSELQSLWNNISGSSEEYYDLIFDMRKDPASKRIFADAVTVFFVVTNRSARSSFSIYVDQDQFLLVTVENSKVTLVHEAPAENNSHASFDIAPNVPLVVAIRSGSDPKNILIMVNGEYRTIPIQNKGMPINFSYLESRVYIKNIQEAFVIKDVMEPSEMNFLSKHVASKYGIPTIVSPNMPDYLPWSTESALFPQVRNLMRQHCFSCHSSWTGLSEAAFTKASRFTKNLQLVRPNNLSESLFWHSLSGSSGSTNLIATRNMPKNLSELSAEQLNLIKNWILSIQQ